MRRVLSAASIAALALTMSASAVFAQIGTSLGLRAGVSVPMAALETSQEMGYNLGVSLGLKPMLSPVGFRAEAAFNQFGAKSAVGVDARIFEGTANIILDLFPMPTMALYAIGGGGFYNSKFGSGTGSRSSSDAGINVGAGLRFGLAGFNAHVEARWHNVFSDPNPTRYIPITVGISF